MALKRCVTAFEFAGVRYRVGDVFDDTEHVVILFPSRFGTLGGSDETFDIAHGPVLTDTSDTHTYRLVSTAGTLVLTQVS